MGRPPHGGGPVFRFNLNEVVEMEACLQEINNAIPPREIICALADKFSASPERVGKIAVQAKQETCTKSKIGQAIREAKCLAPTGRTYADNAMVEFEAKSARDGAWYDVSAFLSHRMFETGDPEVRVRFSGFGVEEDEWINVRRCVRQRSLPCEAAECVAVLPGDLILCFQEGKEQALYFDAHVLDVRRRRHDVRGCRCRFLVRYDHDQSEEIVPLRKVCRRPETDYRMQILQASKMTGHGDLQATARDLIQSSSKDLPSQRTRKQRKLMYVNTDEVTTVSLPHAKDSTGTQGDNPAAGIENSSSTPLDLMEDAAVDTNRVGPQQEGNT